MTAERVRAMPFLARGVGGFDRHPVVIPAGGTRPYVETEWDDAFVVATRGAVELLAVDGRAATMRAGAVLCLHRLALRALHNPGHQPAVLTVVRRARPEAVSPRRS